MKYRDDRMFVLRLSANFQTSEGGVTVINGKDFVLKSRSDPVALITYRNTIELPSFRMDHFDDMDKAEAYIKQIEPTCPRVSLGGNAPDPIPTWEKHLEWLHANGLISVLEGDNPLPHWVR